MISNERSSNLRDKSADTDTIESFHGHREKATRMVRGSLISPQSPVRMEISASPKFVFHYSGAAACSAFTVQRPQKNQAIRAFELRIAECRPAHASLTSELLTRDGMPSIRTGKLL
jgi:hypothetical protein